MEPVLASASPRRAELLKETELSFRVDPPSVREDIGSYCNVVGVPITLAFGFPDRLILS